MTRASIWLYRRTGTSTEQQGTQLHSEHTQGKLTGVKPHFIPATVTDMEQSGNTDGGYKTNVITSQVYNVKQMYVSAS